MALLLKSLLTEFVTVVMVSWSGHGYGEYVYVLTCRWIVCVCVFVCMRLSVCNMHTLKCMWYVPAVAVLADSHSAPLSAAGWSTEWRGLLGFRSLQVRLLQTRNCSPLVWRGWWLALALQRNMCLVPCYVITKQM